MFTAYTIEFFNGDIYKGKSYENGLTWGGLMMTLSMRKKAQEIRPGRKSTWDNVTIWEWKNENEKRLLRSGMEKF